MVKEYHLVEKHHVFGYKFTLEYFRVQKMWQIVFWLKNAMVEKYLLFAKYHDVIVWL